MEQKWTFEKFSEWVSDLPSKFEKWLKDLKEFFSKLISWELFKTKTNLDSLASDLIDDKINIMDEKISDEEKKVLEKIKELDKNDKHIESWLNWIDDIDDESLKIEEIQTLLSDLQKEADDDEDKKWDLDENEFKEIWKKAKIKKELCEKTLEVVMNDNTIPDDKKNKTAVIRAYNDVLSENNWDISQVTQEKIIEKLKNSSES